MDEITPSEIKKARKTISEAFDRDPDFERGYVDNIAMCLYDGGWLKRPNMDRNDAARAVLDLIFRS